ncbi:MAG: hypothetical protein JEZ01_20955 [Labilibaculum sp.]|nr:hypothetical protein [Labilibaculum sp.]MBI9060249.1 hypothetical protein [Labilibaculum sp.]
MEKIEKQQYKFEEFDEYVSLFNIVPAGNNDSLVLLRKIVDGIQSDVFDRNPCVLIVGEGSKDFAISLANSLCSDDIREFEAKYLNTTQSQMEFLGDSLYDTIHILNNINSAGMSESMIWSVIKNRKCRFNNYRGDPEIYYHINGQIILTAEKIESVPVPILAASDFKVLIEPYTQNQLELLVHQRLWFCGIDYGKDEEVLKTIVEYGKGELQRILNLIKICILLAQTEGESELSVEMVKRASRMY